MVGAHILLSGDQGAHHLIAFFINNLQENGSWYGGEGGIRTLEGLQTLAGFQDQCIQPLCHLSGFIKNVLGFTHSG